MSLSLSRSREPSGCGNSFIGLEILYLLPPSEKHRRKLKLTMLCKSRWDKQPSEWKTEVQFCTVGLLNKLDNYCALCIISSCIARVFIGTTCVTVLSLFFTFRDSHCLFGEACLPSQVSEKHISDKTIVIQIIINCCGGPLNEDTRAAMTDTTPHGTAQQVLPNPAVLRAAGWRTAAVTTLAAVITPSALR